MDAIDRHTIDHIDHLPKLRLSIPLVAAYLSRGKTQVEIARACNLSRQAINQYISTHYDDLLPLIGDDHYLGIKTKHIANQAMDKMSSVLIDIVPDKKDLVTLNIIAGTMIDKSRLLSGQPTVIIDHNIVADLSDVLSAIPSEDIIDVSPPSEPTDIVLSTDSTDNLLI